MFNYTIGFSSSIGLPGAVLLVELAISLKLCTDPERDVETFVYEKIQEKIKKIRWIWKKFLTLTLSYAPPTLCSNDLKDSEFFIWDSFDVKPLNSEEVFSAVALTTDSVLW